MGDEVRLYEPLPNDVVDAMRALYVAPPDGGYWDGLEVRVMARVREAAGADAGEAGDADVRGAVARAGMGRMRRISASVWVRTGLVAAAAVLAVVAALLLRAHASDLREQYRALTSPGAHAAADSLVVPSGALGAREDSDGATLRDVISK